MLAVVRYPSLVLTTRCENVIDFDDDLKDLVDRMLEAMYASGGVGLAAPQVGLDKRLLVFDPSGGEEPGMANVLINPEVTWRSTEQRVGQEGCLSMPGVVLHVPRASAVDVEYHDLHGQRVKRRWTDMSARIVQHECDHLDGIMMVDRVGKLTRRLAMKELESAR